MFLISINVHQKFKICNFPYSTIKTNSISQCVCSEIGGNQTQCCYFICKKGWLKKASGNSTCNQQTNLSSNLLTSLLTCSIIVKSLSIYLICWLERLCKITKESKPLKFESANRFRLDFRAVFALLNGRK